jgi:hypothetical protein
MDLVEFLKARLDEDEAAARKAAAFKYDRPTDAPWERARLAVEQGTALSSDEHIARHDPARVLREVEAKRTILERHDWWFNRPTETDAELHARCAHPDYEYETTEGGRKTWDYAHVPPLDDQGGPDHTWERNLDAGIPGEGWERFDYTEESYWRRRLPSEKAAEKRRRKEQPPRELLELAAVYADHPDYQPEWKP